MFDMLSGQYKNLASKGRYGDTMLAHINPQEAALLKSMGGAGTVNPQTGLPEFFGFGGFTSFPQRVEEPLPSLGQALAPESLANLSTQLNTTTVPTEYRGLQGSTPAYEKVNPEFNQYADRDLANIMGGAKIQGYTIPTEQKFQNIPLVAQYDAQGNFKHLTLEPGQYLYPDPSQPNIVSAPKINAKGEIIDYGVGDLNEFNSSGGLGGFVKDFAPMIALGFGANLLGPTAGAVAGGGGAAALSPYAAQAAGAYTGSAAAAAGAAAGNLGAIQAANLAQNTLTADALARTGITYGGNLTPASIPTTGPTPTQYPAPSPTTGSGSGSPMPSVTPPPVLPPTVTPPPVIPPIPTSSIFSGGVPGLIDAAIKNPSITGTLLGAVTAAVGAANAPTSQTTTSSIDPDIKAKYLAYLEDAKLASTGLTERKFAPIDPMYTTAETNLYNLGMTPFGATVTPSAVTPTGTTAATNLPVLANDIARFFNPYENQVVTNTLADIERTRLMQEQANRDQATRARAFGGSRQGVVTGMTNEAALRQAANTAAQLRSAGFTQAANLGLAARPLDIAGLQTSLGIGTARNTLAQQKLDATRNLALEKLAITGGALGLQPANVGGTTSQPLYNNTAGNLLSGGLTGAYIGSLLQPRTT